MRIAGRATCEVWPSSLCRCRQEAPRLERLRSRVSSVLLSPLHEIRHSSWGAIGRSPRHRAKTGAANADVCLSSNPGIRIGERTYREEAELAAVQRPLYLQAGK